jgi:methionyl-tRNA formyltransferase
MALEEGLDTGPIYASEEVAIGPDETADELRARLGEHGTALLVDLLDGDHLPKPRPQLGEPTYAAKLAPADHHLDWHLPAVELHRVVRVGQAWTTFRGSRLKVHRTRLVHDAAMSPGVLDPTTLVVGTGDGGLQLVEVQPEGRPVQSAGAWRNGARLVPEVHLGG